MRDPFVDGGSGGIIVGSDCCVCNGSVCVSPVSTKILDLNFRSAHSSMGNDTVGIVL